MFAQERYQNILDILSEKGRFSVAALQRQLRISPATLRRDLAEMESRHLVVRVHGGVMHPCAVRGELSFAQKGARAVPAKKSIARETARLIPDGATVFIDSGTTCMEVGQMLLPRRGLTLITNSVPLLSLAVSTRGAQVIGVGGEVRAISGALTGALSLAWLGSLHADIAVVSASGLSLKKGVSTTELGEAAVKQQFLERSGRSILVADGTKWNAPSTIKFAEWKQFDAWVTDLTLKPAERAALHASHLEIIEAKDS